MIKKQSKAEISEEMQRIIERAQELIDATADEVDDKVKSARNALIRGLDNARNESGRFYERGIYRNVRLFQILLHLLGFCSGRIQ